MLYYRPEENEETQDKIKKEELEPRNKFRVKQVVIREELLGVGTYDHTDIEDLCNKEYADGYKLYNFSQSTCHSVGLGGGDRTICNLIFERIDD